MEPASRTLEVLVREPDVPREHMGRVLLGPLASHRFRYEVAVVDRVTRAVVCRTGVDRSRHEADALAALMRGDLERLDERAFLKRHGRGNRSR